MFVACEHVVCARMYVCVQDRNVEVSVREKAYDLYIERSGSLIEQFPSICHCTGDDEPGEAHAWSIWSSQMGLEGHLQQ